MRSFVAGVWLWLTPEQRAALLTDPVPAVRQRAAQQARILDLKAMEADLPERDCHHRSMLLFNYAVSRAVAECCLAARRNLRALASNPHTPSEIVMRLAQEPDPKIRERVASRCDLDPALLAHLAEDPDATVRTRALVYLLRAPKNNTG